MKIQIFSAQSTQFNTRRMSLSDLDGIGNGGCFYVITFAPVRCTENYKVIKHANYNQLNSGAMKQRTVNAEEMKQGRVALNVPPSLLYEKKINKCLWETVDFIATINIPVALHWSRLQYSREYPGAHAHFMSGFLGWHSWLHVPNWSHRFVMSKNLIIMALTRSYGQTMNIRKYIHTYARVKGHRNHGLTTSDRAAQKRAILY